MAKFIYFLFGASVMIGMVWLIGCEKNEKPQAQGEATKEKIDEEFFVYVEQLSKDPSRSKEYLGIVGRLAKIVQTELQKNPFELSSFIEEIIPLIPEAGPTVAIQVESYANDVIKKEMDRLRLESGVQELKVKDQEIVRYQALIADLQKQTSALQEKVNNYDASIKAKENELNVKTDELQKKDGKISEYQSLVKYLEKNISNAQIKIDDLEKFKKSKSASPEKEVLVAIYAKHSFTVKFMFTSVENGRTFMKMCTASEEEIFLAPGQYDLVAYYDDKVYCKKRITVTADPSFKREGRWYNGYVTDFEE